MQAHSGNLYNEQVDQLAKSARYSSNTLILDLSNFVSIQVIPVWKNITITSHLRHFIADLSRNIGFEAWFNLHRNTKYRKIDIDWESTFYVLDNNDPSNTTSFPASARKKSKVKYLMEEIPTVEHIKKRRPDLYSNWLCPRCDQFKESFNHVWLCIHISNEMNQIILDTKLNLVQILNEVVTASCPA